MVVVGVEKRQSISDREGVISEANCNQNRAKRCKYNAEPRTKEPAHVCGFNYSSGRVGIVK